MFAVAEENALLQINAAALKDFLASPVNNFHAMAYQVMQVMFAKDEGNVYIPILACATMVLLATVPTIFALELPTLLFPFVAAMAHVLVVTVANATTCILVFDVKHTPAMVSHQPIPKYAVGMENVHLRMSVNVMLDMLDRLAIFQFVLMCRQMCQTCARATESV